MPSTFQMPGTCENAAGVGTVAWTSASSAEVSDNVNATASLFAEQSNYLVARNFDFSSIPAGSTLTSITVEIEKDGSNGDTKDVVVRLWQAGAVGTNYADTISIWLANVSNVYGSGLWGLSLTRDDVQNSDFGVCISVQDDGSGSIPGIDSISMTIAYIEPGYDEPPAGVADSLGVLVSRRLPPKPSPLMPSIGSDDALIFADLPEETPLAGPGLLLTPTPQPRRFGGSRLSAVADNLDDELSSVDAHSTLLFVTSRISRRAARPAMLITNSPPPDESHPCGCVGTAVLVSDGFATAKFVGASAQPNSGGYSAKLIETGYTAILIDDCDCEA
jgi:hypothetical protein